MELGGVKGTLAVGAAWALHLDLFAGFSFDAKDVAVAFACAAPILIVDAVLMAPDWESAPHTDGAPVVATAQEALSEDQAAAARAAAASPSGSGVPGDVSAWSRFVGAAALFQALKVRGNPAAGLSPIQEGAIIVVGHVADEMLARGVLLTALAHWIKDRLFEADIWADAMNDAAAPWMALAFILGGETARKWRPLSRSMAVQAAVVGTDKVSGKTKLTTIAPDRLDNVASVPGVKRNVTDPENLARIQAQVTTARDRAASVAQIDAFRALLDWVAYGSSYIISGSNLFGPILASTGVDLLFSGYQRSGAARMAEKQRARMEAASAALRAKMAAAAGETGEGTEAGSASGGEDATGAVAGGEDKAESAQTGPDDSTTR